ncbi:MAG: 3-terminal phosphate cyclase [Thermoanaerobaculia bacterium]|jgi:RNA 3'-terminal phosphate cyclase (ATP)|nr:3-terminal phosphate cyclase [Thermoanaerobaculia bacterium]
MSLIVIDGASGEGGGQVLRTALALSLVTGKPFRIENIRAKRAKPGLLRQHLTAVNAAVEIGSASAEGAELGSGTLTFVPHAVRSGDYHFAIGTAGSTTLVLQTILLPLALAGEPSTVAIEGGTHNPNAPPFEFLDTAFLPLLRRMGVGIELELVRPGFYPAGGGAIRVRITPTRRLVALHIEERGEIVSQRVRAVVANLSYEIAQREVRAAAEELGWGEECQQAHTLTGSPGPGNAVSITIASENVTDVFTAFGMRGVRAEAVAHDAAKQAKRYINSTAAIGEHLADQLLLPLALGAGGSFTTTPLSSHAMTNLDVIRRFVDAKTEIAEISRGVTLVRVSR